MPNIKPEHVEVTNLEIKSLDAQADDYDKPKPKGHYVAEYVEGLEKERDEFHRCLLAREETLKRSGEDWVKAKTETDTVKSQLLTAELKMGKMKEALNNKFKCCYNDGLTCSARTGIKSEWCNSCRYRQEIIDLLFSTNSPTPMIDKMVEVLNFWVGPQEMVLSGKLPMDKMIDQSKELLSQLTPLVAKPTAVGGSVDRE